MMIITHVVNVQSGDQFNLSSNLSYFLLVDLLSQTDDEGHIGDLLLDVLMEVGFPTTVQPLGE